MITIEDAVNLLLDGKYSFARMKIEEENSRFLLEVDHIKSKLDKLSDVMENESLLNPSIIQEFEAYIKGHVNFYIKNIN